MYRLTSRGKKRLVSLWRGAHSSPGISEDEMAEWGLLDHLGTGASELEAVMKEVGGGNLDRVLSILRKIKSRRLIEEV